MGDTTIGEYATIRETVFNLYCDSEDSTAFRTFDIKIKCYCLPLRLLFRSLA